MYGDQARDTPATVVDLCAQDPLLRESVAILEQAAEQDSSHIARARNQLGRCLDSLGRSAEAEGLFARARLIQQAQGATPDH